MREGIQHRKVFESYEAAFQTWHLRNYRVHNEDKKQLEEEVRSKLLAMGRAQMEVDHLVYLIDNPYIMSSEKEDLEMVTRPYDVSSKIITTIGGTLYAIVRLMLLALSCAALRSVPEGVYTTTWTKFLPNIS